MYGQVYHHLDVGDSNDTILEHVYEGFWAHKSYLGNKQGWYLKLACNSNKSYPYSYRSWCWYLNYLEVPDSITPPQSEELTEMKYPLCQGRNSLYYQ